MMKVERTVVDLKVEFKGRNVPSLQEQREIKKSLLHNKGFVRAGIQRNIGSVLGAVWEEHPRKAILKVRIELKATAAADFIYPALDLERVKDQIKAQVMISGE
jgi:hypothetical protein